MRSPDKSSGSPWHARALAVNQHPLSNRMNGRCCKVKRSADFFCASSCLAGRTTTNGSLVTGCHSKSSDTGSSDEQSSSSPDSSISFKRSPPCSIKQMSIPGYRLRYVAKSGANKSLQRADHSVWSSQRSAVLRDDEPREARHVLVYG